MPNLTRPVACLILLLGGVGCQLSEIAWPEDPLPSLGEDRPPEQSEPPLEPTGEGQRG